MFDSYSHLELQWILYVLTAAIVFLSTTCVMLWLKYDRLNAYVLRLKFLKRADEIKSSLKKESDEVNPSSSAEKSHHVGSLKDKLRDEKEKSALLTDLVMSWESFYHKWVLDESLESDRYLYERILSLPYPFLMEVENWHIKFNVNRINQMLEMAPKIIIADRSDFERTRRNIILARKAFFKEKRREFSDFQESL